MRVLEHSYLQQPVYTEDPVERRGLFRYICPHTKTTSYMRVDYSGGYGNDARVYDGEVCVQCGSIINESRQL